MLSYLNNPAAYLQRSMWDPQYYYVNDFNHSLKDLLLSANPMVEEWKVL